MKDNHEFSCCYYACMLYLNGKITYAEFSKIYDIVTEHINVTTN